jgi:Uri superfamily endonuclease
MKGIDKGVYLLVIYLSKSRFIKVGRLGGIRFPRGVYVYVGRARRALRARLNRHCRRSKRLRWHIDYLTSHRDASLARIYTFSKGDECKLARDITKIPGATIVANRFGASDCKNQCQGHLILFPVSQRDPI